MRQSGRNKDAIWQQFEELPSTTGKSGSRARCKACGKEMQGLVQRLKLHKESCNEPIEKDLEVLTDESIIMEHEEISESEASQPLALSSSSTVFALPHPLPSSGQHSKRRLPESPTSSRSPSPTPSPLKKSSSNRSMDSFIIKTSLGEKETIDEKVATMIYATNSPFHIVEHKAFKEMIEVLRPGYKLPSRHDIGNKYLNKIFETETNKCVSELEGKGVCMSIDGWTNVSNEPIICVSITSQENSNTYLVDTIDTSGKPHTAEYLKEITKQSIKLCKDKYKCNVLSLVTDNAANVSKMRAELLKDQPDIIAYGCSAHILNLLAKDLEIENIKEHIVQIIKYFRNNHAASAAYKHAGGSALIMPQEVRWNTMVDCLHSYITNWPKLVAVSEGEMRAQLSSTITKKVMDTSIKRNAEEMYKLLKHVAVALDQIQSDKCNIGEATEIWKRLKQELMGEEIHKIKLQKIEQRMHLALTPAHFLANILHPKYKGKILSTEEESTGMEWANEKYSSIIGLILKFKTESAPFPKYMFSSSAIEVGPLVWWQSIAASKCDSSENLNELVKLANILFTTSASSAGVERIFSSFGMIQSKLRNRLGTEKAAKLVFIYKCYNSKEK